MIHPRALLFDMDGLMVDSEPLWFHVQRAFAGARGGIWTPELAESCVGRGLVNAIRTMGEQFGFAVDLERDQADIIERFISHVATLELKAGFRELLAEARGRVPIAVASSSARRLVEAVLAHFEITDAFGAIVSGDDVAEPKPMPDIFLKAASGLGVEPAGCVVFEDSLAGAIAGRAAGMKVIAVPERVEPKFAREADFVVNDLFEARRLITFGPLPASLSSPPRA